MWLFLPNLISIFSNTYMSNVIDEETFRLKDLNIIILYLQALLSVIYPIMYANIFILHLLPSMILWIFVNIDWLIILFLKLLLALYKEPNLYEIYFCIHQSYSTFLILVNQFYYFIFFLLSNMLSSLMKS